MQMCHLLRPYGHSSDPTRGRTSIRILQMGRHLTGIGGVKRLNRVTQMPEMSRRNPVEGG